MITPEPFTPALLAELAPLIRANHDLVYPGSTLDPQWDTFAKLSDGGALCLLVVRDDTGTAVGYAAHVAQINQNSGERHAVCLAIYLDPSRCDLWLELTRETEKRAKAAGCHVISYGIPLIAGRLFWKMGYAPRELIVEKRLAP